MGAELFGFGNPVVVGRQARLEMRAQLGVLALPGLLLFFVNFKYHLETTSG